MRPLGRWERVLLLVSGAAMMAGSLGPFTDDELGLADRVICGALYALLGLSAMVGGATGDA